MENIKIEISLDNIKEKVDAALSAQIKKVIDDNNMSTIMKNSIEELFKKPSWNESRISNLEKVVTDAFDSQVTNAVWEIMSTSGIKDSIKAAVETVMKDTEFLAEIARLKIKTVISESKD